MKPKFAYVFALAGELEWSEETENSLLSRIKFEDQNLVLDFIKVNKVGNFIKLSTGEMVFQTFSTTSP